MPVIVPGVGGVRVLETVIAEQVCELDPQELSAVTQIFPELIPNDTVIELVACPEVIVAPEGTVQV